MQNQLSNGDFPPTNATNLSRRRRAQIPSWETVPTVSRANPKLGNLPDGVESQSQAGKPSRRRREPIPSWESFPTVSRVNPKLGNLPDGVESQSHVGKLSRRCREPIPSREIFSAIYSSAKLKPKPLNSWSNTFRDSGMPGCGIGSPFTIAS